ncbi:ATP-binding cassette domain-containing protein [Dactylosporangium vinaceum]|uniref:ATP-binding cassette domain-containing protein n=1 Tax=Dactylosporangium vinaceum TaxID=53362 RepID=A0ABV5MI54_9ACTN|nr:ATP-binding cassette domain-containing protein [Dactylosporangium vinaceum]UAB94798.1 ATP-binding cassette domain-containing protein [Dactylosporangium vinaceum]
MIIEVCGLRRLFGRVAAVDGLTFGIERGDAVGYIGANGAGKSTTIKMLTGILRPTAGTVRTCGLEPMRQRRRLARRIGVVFGQRSQLWWDLPLRDSYRALGAIHRLDFRPRLAELAERLDLGDFLDTPVRQLSLGQRIRGEVAAALLHAPELLILDEPTIGLDVLSKERLRSFLIEQRAAGTSLLLATHDMGDVRRLTDRLLVVDHGRLAFDGTLDGLARQVGAERILVLDLAEPAPPLDFVAGTRLVGVEAGGLRQRLSFAPGTTTVAAILAAVATAAQLHDLTIEEPDIEAVVRRLYSLST